jgi:hypothetical protein
MFLRTRRDKKNRFHAKKENRETETGRRNRCVLRERAKKSYS